MIPSFESFIDTKSSMITDGNDDNNCIIFGLLFDNNTILLANNFLSLSLMTLESLVINILAMSAASLVLRRGMMMGLGSFDKPFNRSPNNDNDGYIYLTLLTLNFYYYYNYHHYYH